MALNFTVSYTFSPSTTISSSQVNTNTSDVAAVFQGLEAETKTLAKLKVDIDPTLALEVATKQYVDHYSTWRRPNLVSASVTTVTVESGLDGTSGDIPILFPDGTVRTETSVTHTTFDITRNCALSGSAQSGLRATLSEATNTWYALYAVKVTDTSTTWVTVGDTRLPTQANYANLNTAFGTNGWVYLGLIRNGDGSTATGDILAFAQSGNKTIFDNSCTGNAFNSTGIRLATSASATNITYTYSAGTAGAVIPNNVTLALWTAGSNAGGSGTTAMFDSSGALNYFSGIGTVATVGRFETTAAEGLKITTGGAIKLDIFISGFVDGALGVGSNPIL